MVAHIAFGNSLKKIPSNINDLISMLEANLYKANPLFSQ